MLPASPFLVHRLFAIGGRLLRGGIISRDRFLMIEGKATIIYCIFHKTSVTNDVWNVVMSCGPEYCMQYSWWEDGWFVTRLESLPWRWKLMRNTQNPEPNKTPKKIPTPHTQSQFFSHTQSSTHHNPTSAQSCYGKCYWKTENQWPTKKLF